MNLNGHWQEHAPFIFLLLLVIALFINKHLIGLTSMLGVVSQPRLVVSWLSHLTGWANIEVFGTGW